MSRNYHPTAFTPDVVAAQVKYGSRRAQNRVHPASADDGAQFPHDPLTEDERSFLHGLDGFYLASVSETGWPYVQFRGGPPGFIRTPDEHTIAWAEFRGNRQYVSTGNLMHDDRVAMIFMNYALQLRLKVFGRARIRDLPRDDPAGTSSLAVPDYDARVERELRVDVVAYDWNCPQHITPRYTVEEIATLVRPSA